MSSTTPLGHEVTGRGPHHAAHLSPFSTRSPPKPHLTHQQPQPNLHPFKLPMTQLQVIWALTHWSFMSHSAVPLTFFFQLHIYDGLIICQKSSLCLKLHKLRAWLRHVTTREILTWSGSTTWLCSRPII